MANSYREEKYIFNYFTELPDSWVVEEQSYLMKLRVVYGYLL